MQGKLIIFSAPSGSGKSTIINYLLQQNLNLAFSISATSRAPRGNERNGVEYYFMSPEEFKTKISNNEFLEYEEVYADKFYGTLKCEVERLVAKGKNVFIDIHPTSKCGSLTPKINRSWDRCSGCYRVQIEQSGIRTFFCFPIRYCYRQ